MFGEVGAVEGSTRLTTVTAAGDCTLLELGAAVLGELSELDPGFAARLNDRARLHLSRVAVRPLDFGGGDAVSGVTQRPAVPPPSEDERMAAGVAVADEPAEAEPWVAPRKFPLVRQIDFADCGVAALAMVCRAFGRKVSLPFIRHAAATGQEGTSLRGIMRAADEAGLEARALKASKDRLAELQLPAIIHWEGNHWIVLYAVEGDHVRVADPGRGLRRLSRAEVDEKWSGWCATFRPTPRFAEAPVEHLDLSWIRPFVRPLRNTLAIATALAIAATALSLVAPVMTQRVVDAAAQGRSGHVSLLILVIVALLFLGLGINLFQRRLLARAAVRLDAQTLNFVSTRLLELPLKYFEARRTADIERRLDGLRQVRVLVTQTIVGGLSAVVQLAVTLFILFKYSWVIAVVFLATAPAYGLLMRYSSHRLRPTFDSLEEAYARHSSKQLDAIKGIEAAKSAGAEEGLRRGIQREFNSLADRVFRSDWVLMAYGDAAVQVTGFLLFVLFLWIGALLVANGTLTIGELVAINSLVLLANAPLIGLLGLWDQMLQGSVLLQRLQDVLEAEPEQIGTTARRCEASTGCRGGSRCATSGSRTPTRPIGRSSTTSRSRSSPGRPWGSSAARAPASRRSSAVWPDSSCPATAPCCTDEADLRELDWRQSRCCIGVVLQAPYLFDNTITANIALGEDEPDPMLVQRAAEIADAAGFIESMALAYDTKVGDSGIKLSGGRRSASASRAPLPSARRAAPSTRQRARSTPSRRPQYSSQSRPRARGAHGRDRRPPAEHDSRTHTIADANGRIVEHGTARRTARPPRPLLPPTSQPGRVRPRR